MGKKGALASIFSRLLVADSPPSPASESPSPPWPWLSSPCRNPQTSSSRDHRRAVTRSPAGRLRGGGAGAGDDDMYKTANSAYQLDDDYPCCFSPDDGGSCFDADEDEERGKLVEDHDGGFSTTSASEEWRYASEAVIRGLGRAGGRRFFVDRPDPLASNSILAGSPSSALPEKKEEEARPSVLVEASVAVAVDSADPYGDFRASMEEMVSAHGLRGWPDLQELLTWYLRVNAKRNHALIVAAFVDLLVALAASSPSAAAADADAPTTTTTTMMTTTSSSASGSASSGSTSASSSTCGCAGTTTAELEQCCGGRGNDAERPCSLSGASEEAVGDEAGDGGYCTRVVDS